LDKFFCVINNTRMIFGYPALQIPLCVGIKGYRLGGSLD